MTYDVLLAITLFAATCNLWINIPLYIYIYAHYFTYLIYYIVLEIDPQQQWIQKSGIISQMCFRHVEV